VEVHLDGVDEPLQQVLNGIDGRHELDNLLGLFGFVQSAREKKKEEGKLTMRDGTDRKGRKTLYSFGIVLPFGLGRFLVATATSE
jgi:hypothetical protein